MQSIIEHPVDVCPNCGEICLEYGVLVPESEAVYYPWECKNCGATGEQWYNLEFTNHERVKVLPKE